MFSPLKSAKKKFSPFESLEDRHLLAADLLSFSPADDSIYVDGRTDLELTFSSDVVASDGTIEIRTVSDGELVESIAAGSDQVTIDGSSVTIDPVADLGAGVSVYVTVSDDAFVSTGSTIFVEDFEGVELLPFEVESDGNDEDTDWTDELPEGWERDNTDTPEDGPIEFFGFNIFDKESWIVAAGNQSRGEFTLGEGNVMVVDPDEYDDLGDIDPDQMEVYVTSPEVDLDGIAANSVTLKFDSSFRPYPTMQGLVDVSYDGGDTWENLLTLNDETVEGGTSSLSRVNTVESLELNNPANGSVQVRFGMIDAGNDWWWAFDNVTLEVTSDDGDAVEGITDETAWNFTTAPVFSPLPMSETVAVNSSLTVTFEQEVKLSPGEGNFEIRRVADDSVFETLPVAGDRVTVSGMTITIDPVADLEANTEYYVTLDDLSVFDTAPVDGPGISIFSEDFEGLPLIDSGLVGGLNIDDYAVVMTGTLDVKVAGEYTFGTNSDDGQLLAIDLDQDGLDDPFFDAVIVDDSTHGTEDRLSSCGDGEQSCIGNGFGPIDLDVGEYEFEYRYFDRSGGSGGEFFYAPGDFEEFVDGEFVLIGDDSKGIGVTADGITATTYKAVVNDELLDQINSLDQVDLLLEGVIEIEEGFPASETIEFADVYNTGGAGRFRVNNPLPGYEAPEPDPDYSPDAPEGWVRESNIPVATPEYDGWSFLNKDFWIAQQGNQARTTFTKGEGTLAVLDPDAIDDFTSIESDSQYEAYLETPEISLEGLEPNSVSLQFDSSYRPYPSMEGLVDVSFDGGDSWENLVVLNDETVEGGTSSLERANSTEVFEIDNPRGGTVKFRWGIINAGNDWWWAIDNVRVNTAFQGNPIPGFSDSSVWSFSTSDGTTPELEGDANGDGKVDFTDFLALSAAFGQDVDPPGSGADFDGSGTVDFTDFLILSGNFGQPAAAAAVDAIFAS